MKASFSLLVLLFVERVKFMFKKPGYMLESETLQHFFEEDTIVGNEHRSGETPNEVAEKTHLIHIISRTPFGGP